MKSSDEEEAFEKEEPKLINVDILQLHYQCKIPKICTTKLQQFVKLQEEKEIKQVTL